GSAGRLGRVPLASADRLSRAGRPADVARCRGAVGWNHSFRRPQEHTMSHTDQQAFAPQGPGSYHSPGPPPGGPATPPGSPATPPPPKQKSWFARHKFLTAILVIVGLIVIAAALSGGDDDAPAGSTPAAETAPAE